MNVSKRLPRENARTYAHREILDNIINLELPPGSAVSENDLSTILKVSRTPVREALIEMSHLGLIEIIPQKGSFVTKIDYELIEDAKFIRMSLENTVVRLACKEGIPEPYMERIRDNLARQKQWVDKVGGQNVMMDLDNEFHKLLFESMGKERVFDAMKTQMVHFDRLRVLTYQKLKNQKTAQTVSDHENIVYALEKRDAELAEVVMTLHLTRHQVDKEELIVFCPEYFV